MIKKEFLFSPFVWITWNVFICNVMLKNGSSKSSWKEQREEDRFQRQLHRFYLLFSSSFQLFHWRWCSCLAHLSVSFFQGNQFCSSLLLRCFFSLSGIQKSFDFETSLERTLTMQKPRNRDKPTNTFPEHSVLTLMGFQTIKKWRNSKYLLELYFHHFLP